MHIHVRGSGAHGPYKLRELAAGDALTVDREHLVRLDGAFDGPGCRARRGVGLNRLGSRVKARFAQPDDDTAHRMLLSEMDMRLPDNLNPLVVQLVINDLPVLIDLGAEASACIARYGAAQCDRRAGYQMHFIESGKAGAEPVLP